MDQELINLRSQVRDISDLAREYRGQLSQLNTELSNYRRREPLIQLLWQEIVQVKSALEAAVAAGYSYDAGEPLGRYIDLQQLTNIADVHDLDVAKILQAEEDCGGGGEDGNGQNNRHIRNGSKVNSKKGRHSHTGSIGAANAFLDNFIPSSTQQQQQQQQTTATTTAVNSDNNGISTINASPISTGLSVPVTRRNSLPALVLTDMTPSAPSLDLPSAPPLAPDMIPSAPSAPFPPTGPLIGPSSISAAVPTKAVITPIKKMKPIHWQRMIINNKLNKDQTPSIWEEIENMAEIQNTSIDIEELTKSFCDQRGRESMKNKQPLTAVQHLLNSNGEVAESKEQFASSSTTNSGRSSASSSAPFIRVLSDKRFNSVSIMMTSLPDIQTVIKAIHTLDITLLNKDQVANIRKNLSDETELNALLSIPSNQTTAFSKPDNFMYQLAMIEQIGSRLDCWHFQLNFNELIEEITSPLVAINKAIMALRNSLRFKQLMYLILTTGNYMNGGTSRGQADGFEITVLSRLSSLRDITNQTSLLVWILEQAQFKYSQQTEMDWLQLLEEELQSCNLAAEYPLKQASGAANRFIALVKTMKNTSTLVFTSIKNQTDPFLTLFAHFNNQADIAAMTLLQQSTYTTTLYNDLCTYLHPTQTKHVSSEDLFTMMKDLYLLVKEIRIEKEQTKAESNRVKRIEEAKKAANAMKEQQKALIGRVEQVRLQQEAKRQSLSPNPRAATIVTNLDA